MDFKDLVPTLQVAIGPVILISGVGLLLLSMTNRFGRVIDRTRQMADALRKAPPLERSSLSNQLQILIYRARLVRLCIALASLSVLLAAILVIGLFFMQLLRLDAALPIVILFIACLISLVASLVVFIMDINLSLTALEHEIEVEK